MLRHMAILVPGAHGFIVSLGLFELVMKAHASEPCLKQVVSNLGDSRAVLCGVPS